MADKKQGSWRQFQKLNVNRKNLSKHAKKAESASFKHAHKFIVGRWNNIQNVRRHVIGWLLLVGVLVAAVGLQLSWFQRSYSVDAPTEGGTYAEATLGPIESLNPLYASTSAELSASELLFSSLYGYDTTGNLQTDLATNTAVNKEGTVYTISLRPDARWHDGAKLTAADVAFTIDVLRDPSSRTTISGWEDIEAEVIDDQTVRITLPASYAAFRHALTFPIIPQHILGDTDPASLLENDFSQSPIGSGPFRLRYFQTIDLTTDRKIVHLGANEEYYKGAPKLARFQLHAFGTTDAIAQSLRTNEVNAAADITPDQAEGVNIERYAVISKPVNNGVYSLFNTDSPILSDVDVRRALQVGTNTAKIREVLKADARALDLPFIDGQLTGDDIPRIPEFNADRAKKILDEAGWKVGQDGIRKKDDTALKLKITALAGSENEAVVQQLSEQWRRLGVSVEAEILGGDESGVRVVQDYLQPRNFDVLLYELTIGADPDIYAYWHSSQATMRGLNFSNYSNDIADDALSSARLREDPELRNAKYISFAQQWIEDAPAIGLYQPVFQYVHNKGSVTMTENIRLVSPRDRYANVLYWTVNNSPVYKTP